MKKSIGILGGMGPLATVDMLQKIIHFTKAGSDSEHIRVYVDNNPSIPDRTEAILNGGLDPIPTMTDSMKNLERCGADCIIMPCNTAHFFLPKLQEMTDVPFLNMLEATVCTCKEKMNGKTAGLLGTSGTLTTGLYSNMLETNNIPYLIPGDVEQEMLMRIIYNGVKAGADPETYRENMIALLEKMMQEGADYFILGCTELPLVFQLLGLSQLTVDPTIELAKAAIRFCGYEIHE